MVNDLFEKATAFFHIVKDLRDDERHPTTKKKRQELDKKARRAIASRPLDPLLRAPPFDTPAREILVTDKVDDILASLEAVYEATLSPSLSRDQRFLRYVFTLWPALCKWSLYLAVLCRWTILSHREWISTVTIHVAIRAQLALTSYLKLKRSLSDWSFILAADHSALFALTLLYLSNSRLEFGILDTESFSSNFRIPTYPFHLRALAQTCAEHIGLCIDIHKQLGNVAPAVSTLQATVRSKPGRLYNAIGRYIRMISTKDDMSDSDLTVHFSLIAEFMVHPELAVCRFSRTTVANLLLGLHRISTAPPARAYPPTTLDALWSIFGMIRGSGQMATVVAVKSGLVDKFAALASRPSADLAPFYRAAGCDPGESWTTTQPSASFWELAGGVGVLAKAMSKQHLAARCSKRDCDSGHKQRIYACACARVVYCSKACQRLHWKEGAHRETCKGRDEREDALNARDIHMLSLIVRDFVVHHLRSILAQYPAGRVRVVVDARKPATYPDLQIFPLEDSSSSKPLIFVEATMHPSWPLIEVSVRPWASVKPQYQLLTDVYTPSRVGWTPNEG